MRLFASLSLGAHAAEHLDLAVRSVDAGDPNHGRRRPALRWVPTEQRHITIAFFGEVPGGSLEPLAEDLDDAFGHIEPFPVRIRGAGVFTGRTLWAGVQQVNNSSTTPQQGSPAGDPSPLLELMRSGEATGARYARQPESVARRQRRRAHVTLARARDRRRGEEMLRARAEALAIYEGPAWTVSEVQLIHSELGQGKSGGPLYTTVAGLRLGN